MNLNERSIAKFPECVGAESAGMSLGRRLEVKAMFQVKFKAHCALTSC
jgi:hypothetical protein